MKSRREASKNTIITRTVSTPNILDSQLPSPGSELPDLQTRPYNDVVRRTSTPKNTANGTSQRPRPAPRRTLQPNVPQTSPRPAPRTSSNNQPNQILLIGDSLISSVKPKGLNVDVIKNGNSGAKVQQVIAQIKVYDIRKISHVIIYIGGNDANNGTDIELLEELYSQVIQHIKDTNEHCDILLCNIRPRTDTDVTEVNGIIKSLAEHHGVKLINQNKAFCDRNENMIEKYYDTDGIHLTSSGVKRLLGTINREVDVVNDFATCFYGRHRDPNNDDFFLFKGRIHMPDPGRRTINKELPNYVASAVKVTTRRVAVDIKSSFNVITVVIWVTNQDGAFRSYRDSAMMPTVLCLNTMLKF